MYVFREFFFYISMKTEMMADVSEIGFIRVNFGGKTKRLFKIKVRVMRFFTQSIEHQNIKTLKFFTFFICYGFDIC